jgi:2,6-dihydroxypseudooxynicotine hydrolase
MIDLNYDTLNVFSRLVGVKRLMEAFIPNALYRAVKFQIDLFEVHELLEKMRDFHAWPDAWQKKGESFEKLADEKEELGFKTSAREFYLAAAYRYHFGQLYTEHRDSRKETLHRKCVQCYRKAGRFFAVPLQEVKIPFESIEMEGYLRMPPEDSPPCVIMLGGADSTKEEAHYQADAFLERGMAVLYFDGPGQGETGYILKMTENNFENAVSSALNFLNAYEIDSKRIGVYGISLGGYLAIRTAAHEPRIKAAISVGGFYNLSYDEVTVATRDALKSILGLENHSNAKKFVDEKMTLQGLMEKVKCPVLIVHGEREHMFAKDKILQMVREIQHAELQTYEDGVHALVNVDNLVRPMIADWMQSRLDK